MALDPSIPLKVLLTNRLDDQAKLQQISDAMQAHEQRRKAAERDDQYRAALGDILTGNGSFTPPKGDVPPVMQGGLPAQQPSTQERAARADPEAYLQFQGKRLSIKAGELKAYRDVNDTAMQLLGGVHDDATLQSAKAQARQLYAQYGLDPAAIDAIPDQYSPELVRGLQMQGMDTAHQLHQVAVENKINWDQYDDQQDNERADLLAGSTVSDRAARRDIARQRLQIARQRAGVGGKPAGQPKSEGAVYADIAHRWLQGQPISPRETRFAKEYEARHTPKGRGVSAGDGAIIRNPKTGQRMKLQNGQWVPIP